MAVLPEASTAVIVSACDWPAVCDPLPVITKRVAAPGATVTEPDVPVSPVCAVAVKAPAAELPT